MQDRILKFISALRSGGVRISLAESSDAVLAVEELGVKDRNSFRVSLRATLIKNAEHIDIFEELFPYFFDSPNIPPLLNTTGDLTPDEANLLAEALQNLKQELRELVDRLLKGELLSQQELDQLGKITGLNNAADLRYREWMAQRMERAIFFRQIKKAIRELMDQLAEFGMNREKVDQINRMIKQNQAALQDQLRQYAGNRIAENMSEHSIDDGHQDLLNQPISSLSEKELDYLRSEIQRLATALRTRVSLRQKRSKNGQLDAKATIRANLKHGNVPIEIRHKDKHKKPKIVVICDVSTSMRPYSEFMLSLLHAMQDQIKKTHAFAFIDHIEYISTDIQGKNAHEAVSFVLDKMPAGHYNTDLGNSLQNFADHYMDKIDSRSTFIVVGDGRNNYNDPSTRIFRELARRSHRTIWLNPEAQALWGSGDSDMPQYAPYCDSILQIRTLSELSAAVDRLLSM